MCVIYLYLPDDARSRERRRRMSRRRRRSFPGRDGRVRRRRPVRLDGDAVGAAAARRQPVEVAVRDVRAQTPIAAPLVRRHDDGDAHLVAIDVIDINLDRRVEVELALI